MAGAAVVGATSVVLVVATGVAVHATNNVVAATIIRMLTTYPRRPTIQSALSPLHETPELAPATTQKSRPAKETRRVPSDKASILAVAVSRLSGTMPQLVEG